MFCFNCGSKLKNNASFCSNCGVRVSGANSVGLSVASLVVGIFGTILAVLYLVSSLNISDDILIEIYDSFIYRIGFAIGSILLPIICAIVGLCLAISARYKNKNGINIAGLVLSIFNYILCAIIAIIVLTV